MKKLVLLTLAICLLLPGISLGQSVYLDESSFSQGAFANYRIDAKALAMGGAYTALSEGATAFYWNPAGLGYTNKKEIAGMYERLYGLINSGYIAYGQGNSKKGEGYGFAWINTSASIDDTLGYSENSLSISYGRQATDKISFGGTIKVLFVSSGFENGSASGFGFNLGTSIRPTSKLKFGIAVRDLLTRVNWATDRKDRLPGKVGIGVAFSPMLPTPKSPVPRLTFAGEVTGEEDVLFKRFSLGVEGWLVKKVLSLRGGFSRNFHSMERNTLSLGTGVEFDAGATRYFLDAAVDIDSQHDKLGTTPLISVGGRF